jgi:hypothetical protein
MGDDEIEVAREPDREGVMATGGAGESKREDEPRGANVEANRPMSPQLPPLTVGDRRSQSLVAQWTRYLETEKRLQTPHDRPNLN